MCLARLLLLAPLVAVLGACSAPAPPAAQTPATLPTNTPAAAVEAAASPLPTVASRLPASLSHAELIALLNPFDKPDCSLPCYNGITPGQATRQDVVDFYSLLGIGVEDMIPGEVEDIQDGTGSYDAWLTSTNDILTVEAQGIRSPLVEIFLENDILVSLYVTWASQPDYVSPQAVINALGLPTQIDLAVNPELDPAIYYLRFIYRPEGASGPAYGFAFYGVTVGEPAAPEVCLLPAQARFAVMGVFAPGFQDVMTGLLYDVYLLPLQETIGVNPQMLQAQMAAGSCLSISEEQMAVWQAIE